MLPFKPLGGDDCWTWFRELSRFNDQEPEDLPREVYNALTGVRPNSLWTDYSTETAALDALNTAWGSLPDDTKNAIIAARTPKQED